MHDLCPNSYFIQIKIFYKQFIHSYQGINFELYRYLYQGSRSALLQAYHENLKDLEDL